MLQILRNAAIEDEEAISCASDNYF